MGFKQSLYLLSGMQIPFGCVSMHVVADTPLLTEISFVLGLGQSILDPREGKLLPHPQSIMIGPNQSKEFKFILVSK